MSKPFKCYVAGKLNADAVGYIQNVHQMISEARKIRELGVAVYVPCNDFLEGLVDGKFTYEDYFENSQPFLEVCDIIYVCPGWETSNGTKKEIDLALSLDKPIFYDLEHLKYAIDHHGI